MVHAWRTVKWRPVVAYSRNHLKGILGLVGKWAMFVLRALDIGIGETSVRGVTEKVHRYNAQARTAEDWRTKKRNENKEAARKKARGMRARRRHRQQEEERTLEKSIWDLTNFFIKVPRKDFFRNVTPELQERIEKAFPDKPCF